MKQFWSGFEKRAADGEKVLAGLAVLGGLGGLGALGGHMAHVSKKVMHAREGKDYHPKSFIERHPKATGAATLGYAPAISAFSTQRELDRENPKVRKVQKEHPLATFGM